MVAAERARPAQALPALGLTGGRLPGGALVVAEAAPPAWHRAHKCPSAALAGGGAFFGHGYPAYDQAVFGHDADGTSALTGLGDVLCSHRQMLFSSAVWRAGAALVPTGNASRVFNRDSS